jgi:Leucine-rich repeat (LRR) protein
LFIILSQKSLKLKIIDLSYSPFLIETPDFTEAPNLEKLIFEKCARLYEVHPSIGVLKQLTLLNLKNCGSLTSLPCNISLDSLEILILSGCWKLKKFPEIVGNMKRLKKLKLDGTAIKELPLSIGRLSGLTVLNLKYCRSLTSLPCNISLDSLETLFLSDCLNFKKVSKIVGNMKRLKELHLDGTDIKELPLSIGHLSGRNVLNLKDCKSLTSLPCNISLDSLEILILSHCWKLKKFSEIVKNMKHLKVLKLDGTAIKEVPSSIGSLSGLIILDLAYCKRLLTLPSVVCNLTSLQNLTLRHCSKVDKMPEDLGNLERLKVLDFSGTAIKQVSSSIQKLKNLEFLSFAGCEGLLVLPTSLLGLWHLSDEKCYYTQKYYDSEIVSRGPDSDPLRFYEI